MDSQATQERAPALPFPLRWNLLAFLQHYNLSIMLSLLSFYSSQERRMRQWYSDVRLAAARKRKKSAAKMRSERFDQYYAAGRHLFTRATLLDVATQIASGEAFLYFDDFLGLLPSRERSRVPSWLTPEQLALHEWSICIDYRSYEKLTCRDPYETEAITDFNPIDISYFRHQDIPIPNNLEQIHANFSDHGESWLQSDECRTIVQTLLSHPSSRRIRKIVAFALGSLARAGADVLPRWTAQHALILGLASALERANNHRIECFAQEPLYADTDKIFLQDKGITVLEDPKGFLEVDEDTLVISISPNVCVKQILADLTRPAAMIWDEVSPQNLAENEWKMKVIDGVMTVYAPYTTDPDSERVRNMIEEYDQLPFQGNYKHFGKQATYMRKHDSSVRRKHCDGKL